ncbi:MAG: A/G-specific adenine glycosylase [Clostridia bacterium]|nr:A/G-specific adenine glycosylase [Clostridia bacterium]
MLKLPDLSPLLPWYEQNKRDLPWRHTKDPYRIWVSEIMLQQTRVEAVLPYYARFLDTLPTVSALANAPEALLLKLWEGLGYYSRVRNMQKAARAVMAVHGGQFPTTYEDIRALCGIGDYTAGAIASFAFDLPYPAVDGNVLRVTARLLCYEQDILSSAAKKELTAAVGAEVGKLPPAKINQALMELGATVCLPNGTPRCEACVLREACAAHAKGLETALPIRKKPSRRRLEEKTVLILRAADRVALQKRPDSGLLAGLFEPFTLAGKQSEAGVREVLAAWGVSPIRIAPLGDAKHIFTHLEWHMTGFEIILDEKDTTRLPAALFFAPREKIDTVYALPSAYRAYRAFM